MRAQSRAQERVRRLRAGRKARRAARACRARRKRRERSPLESFYWLPPQHEFLSWAPTKLQRAVLFRAGNQVFGKTTCGLAEVIFRCLGEHPLKEVPEVPPKGIEAWVICASHKQSKAIQEKCWNLLPKDKLKPGVTFSRATGFRANDPMVEFANGSVIKFRTTQQKTLDLAGATIDVALFDEPPASERTFGEVRKRLLERNGVLLMTLTPINAKVDWLKEEVERGSIHDIHYRLELRHLTAVGRRRLHRTSAGIECDQAWIDRIIRETLQREIPVVVHGEWEERADGALFNAFIADPKVPGAHVTATTPSADLRLYLGIDHGETGANQAFVLVGVDESRVVGGFFSVYVLDEHVSDGASSVQQDAQDVLAMLDRNGLSWSDLDGAYGDNPTSRGPNGKDNLMLAQAIRGELVSRNPHLARSLRSVRNLSPRIKRAKAGDGAGAGSVRNGERWLHKLMAKDGALRVFFHRYGQGAGEYVGCAKFIQCMQEYDGSKSSEHKHLPDATRYALKDYILGFRAPRKRRKQRIQV
jgi:hypothetical protein